MSDKDIARGLAWFGIGLGLLEVCAPAAVAKAAGLEKHSTLIQAFGVREILSGAMILAAEDPQDLLWMRVAGDGLDGALLASGLSKDNPEREKTLMATLAVAPVVLLDLIFSLRDR